MSLNVSPYIQKSPVRLIGLIVLLGVIGLMMVSDYPAMFKNRFFPEKVYSIQEVSVNQTIEEVLYKKGKPSFQISELPCNDGLKGRNCKIFIIDEKLKTDGQMFVMVDEQFNFKNNRYWMYGDFDNNTFVQFNEKGLVDGIRCSNICSPILGIQIGDNENRVTKLLGLPKISKINDGYKRMNYDQFGFKILLEKSTVVGFEIKLD
jgi:hypothetical protein